VRDVQSLQPFLCGALTQLLKPCIVCNVLWTLAIESVESDQRSVTISTIPGPVRKSDISPFLSSETRGQMLKLHFVFPDAVKRVFGLSSTF